MGGGGGGGGGRGGKGGRGGRGMTLSARLSLMRCLSRWIRWNRQSVVEPNCGTDVILRIYEFTEIQ
jgi:hypothetical protein